MKKKITSFFAMALLFAGAANAQSDDLGYKVVSVGEEVLTMDQIVPETQWYAVYQERAGQGNYTAYTGGYWWDKGVGQQLHKSTGIEVFPSESQTPAVAQYVVRFLTTETEGVYNVQFGTGNYFASNVTSTADVANAAQIRMYNILDTEGHWAFNLVNNGDQIMDNNGSGGTLAPWGTGDVTSLDGNNDHKIYAVNIVGDMSESEVLAIKTAAILADVEPKIELAKADEIKLGDAQITNVGQFSSPYTETREGSLDALLDGDAGSYWHSDWSSEQPGGTHYLQVELAQPLEVAVFTFTRRSVVNDHVTQWGVYGTNDSEAAKDACTLLATIDTPFGSQGETLTSTPFAVGDYKYLRFYGETMHPKTRGYFHISEFQLYEAKSTGETMAAKMGEAFTNMEAAVAAAKAEDPITAETYAALESAYKVFCNVYGLPFYSGNYYLKNVESGKYLAGGNSWGTQASLIEHGEHVTLALLPDGAFSLESRVSNGGTKHYLGADGFMDNGTPVSLTFTAVGEYYTMSVADAYYGYDGQSTVLARNLAADAPGALWQVVFEADMNASLATATAELPVDATFLIKDHNFSRNHRDMSAWIVSEDCTNKSLAGGDNTNMCAESYHSVFNIGQTLNVPNGVYALTAQGFYRQDGTDNENLPMFYANDATSTFPLLTGGENSMANASVSFSKGAYTIDPIYVEVTDGTLNVGVKLENNANLWCIWDHFVLTYYGETTIAEVQKVEFVKAYNAAFAAAQAAAAVAMFEADKAVIDQAIADNTLDTAAATMEELAAATDALKVAVAVAEKAAVKYANAQRATEKIADGDGNFTEFIANPSFEVNGAEGWSTVGTVIHGAGNANFELMAGSDFAEAWVQSTAEAVANLADGKLSQTIEGLPAGTYTLTAEMKNTQQGGSDAKGFFLQLGTERVEVSAPATYTVTYEYDGTGALEVAAVLEGCTGNWVCVDNFQLSYPVYPDNVVADPANGATVEGKLAPITLTFSDYDVIAVNPENDTPFSISENGGEMMVVKKGVFVDENTEDNSVVFGVDFWGALSPIATAPGTYVIEVPAGKFLLGAEKVASKKVTLTYTVEAYKPVTPAVEVSLVDDNNVKLLFTEYAAAITNTESTDAILVKSGEEVIKKLTQADVDYAEEWNGLVVKAGLGNGTYTLEIPANIFLFAESETEEPKIPNAAFSVTVVTADNVIVDPKNGSIVKGQLNPITLTFSDYKVIAVNPENTEMVTVSVDGADPVTFKNTVFFDANAEDNSVVFGANKQAKDALITDPGTYTIVIPAGQFLLGDEKTPSKKITLTYTVEAEELFVPVCEASMMEDGNIKLLFPDVYMVTYDYFFEGKLVIKSGDEVVMELGIDKLTFPNEFNAIIIKAGLTEPGTYTIEVPAGMFVIVKENSTPSVTADAFTVTVSVADGIDSIKVNGEDKAYNLSGNRVQKGYKGVVIINGKRYIRK